MAALSDMLQLVSFHLEERLYGLDIRIVKEINPNQNITRVPRTPSYLRGLVNIRGQVVLVMDIAVIFGREPLDITEESQVVILKTAAELRHVQRLYGDLDSRILGDKPAARLGSDLYTLHFFQTPRNGCRSERLWTQGLSGEAGK